MTEEEQNIAIWEFFGWRDVKATNRGGTLHGTWPLAGVVSELADCLRDRNAINTVISDKIVGNDELEKRFLKELNSILDRRADDETIAIFEYEIAQITASEDEFCEALLKTIGKWKD